MKQIKYEFTLIELLVVISIVSLLISILLPALGQARKAAQKIQCLSNIRSYGAMIMVYANDHHQYIFSEAAGSWTRCAWNMRVSGYLQINDYKNIQCPSSVNAVLENDINFEKKQFYQSYGVVSKRDGLIDLAACPTPVRSMLMSDCTKRDASGNPLNVQNGLNCSWSSSPRTDSTGNPYLAHLSSMNTGFVDGHAAALKPEKIWETFFFHRDRDNGPEGWKRNIHWVVQPNTPIYLTE